MEVVVLPPFNNTLALVFLDKTFEYPEALWESYHCSEHCLIPAGLFGGNQTNMLWFAEAIDKNLNSMLDMNIINNEQIVIALVWKSNPERFTLCLNDSHISNQVIISFKALSKNGSFDMENTDKQHNCLYSSLQ